MSGGERLFRCEDPAVWRDVYTKYWAVVEAKASRKQKGAGKLFELEKWYNSVVPLCSFRHMQTKYEVCTL